MVCVIDGGLDLTHQDFEDNHWKNHKEIPGNGIDDDGNNYVDDYMGWNILTDTDNIAGDNHGTAVAGIVGAKGNNNLGVSGVNWNVKVMVVLNDFFTDEALVLEAYTYPLMQRKLYNETNGEKGAFVVATNASWGRDFGQAEDAPLWCSFYDTLGQYGILNCGATANIDLNVDEEGDLPTTCSSDFMVAVTNLNQNDVKVGGAGYGINSIDLGAYGAGTWTTRINNTYGSFGGTSGATPHVSGAIGLLYSAPCPSFNDLVRNDPAAAALLARQYLLEGVTPNNSLMDITVTGGRLNVHNSLQLLLADCGSCIPPTSLTATVTDAMALLDWNITDSVQQVDLRWRAVGDASWTEIMNVSAPYSLNDLLACTEYEVSIRSFCSTNETPYSEPFLFKTDGCCEAPQMLVLEQLGNEQALISWNEVLAAETYFFRIREAGTMDWTETSVQTLSRPVVNLSPCTDYEVQIGIECDGMEQDASAILNFTTLGCGACTDFEYCDF